MPGGKTDLAVRINIEALTKLIEDGKSAAEIKLRVVGEVPSPNDSPVWKNWEACGYTCIFQDESLNYEVTFFYKFQLIQSKFCLKF